MSWSSSGLARATSSTPSPCLEIPSPPAMSPQSAHGGTSRTPAPPCARPLREKLFRMLENFPPAQAQKLIQLGNPVPHVQWVDGSSLAAPPIPGRGHNAIQRIQFLRQQVALGDDRLGLARLRPDPICHPHLRLLGVGPARGSLPPPFARAPPNASCSARCEETPSTPWWWGRSRCWSRRSQAPCARRPFPMTGCHGFRASSSSK